MNPIHVMLIDDSPSFIQATTEFLEAEENIHIVGTAGNGSEAMEHVTELAPNVILLDLAMPTLPGLETLPLLRRELPGARVIVLTALASHHFQRAALERGAAAFLSKARLRRDLVPTIRRVAAGEHVGADPAQVIRYRADVPSFMVDPNCANRRILVIEDEPILSRLYEKALTAAGYQVEIANSLDAGHARISHARFDLLVCDVQVGPRRSPDMLRPLMPELTLTGTQIIMVTGQSEYREICQEMGIDFFLEKPVSLAHLVAFANRLLGQNDMRVARDPVPAP